MEWNSERDMVWRECGLGAPAWQALVKEGIVNVSDLKRYMVEQIAARHGMVPKTLSVLTTVKD